MKKRITMAMTNEHDEDDEHENDHEEVPVENPMEAVLLAHGRL
jgi:hypothetical protein